MYRDNPQLQKFVSLFLEKNTHINLSAIRDVEGIWTKHIEDSLIVTSLLRDYLEQRATAMAGQAPSKKQNGGTVSVIPSKEGIQAESDIESNNNEFFSHLDSGSDVSLPQAMKTSVRNDGNYKVLDLGTGGGFPGIPLAIMFPEVHFTLLDATRKKILCVEEFAKELQLTNVTPQWGRVEDMRAVNMKEERLHNKNGIVFMDGTPSTSDHFDLVVTRATAYIDDLFTWIKPLLKKDGRAWLYKQASEEEWIDGQLLAKNRGFTLEKILTYELAGQERWILQIMKN